MPAQKINDVPKPPDFNELVKEGVRKQFLALKRNLLKINRFLDL